MKKDTKLILIVLAGILAIVLLCIFAVQGTQNKAFTLEEQVNTAQSDIRVQEKRRVDLAEGDNMTPNEYQKEALRTASGMSQEYPRILNGLMGLNGEAGECIDILKKHLFQGHDLDREHMAKELGDVAW